MSARSAASRAHAHARELLLFGVLAATFVFVACCYTDPAGAAVRPLTTGISYIYDEGEPAPTFRHVRRAGSRLAHTPVRWANVAPLQPPAAWQPDNPADPNYDWEDTDRWVREAVAAGLTPVLQIRGAPRWAQRCPMFFGTDTPCDIDPGALGAFTTAAARRYSGIFGGLPRVRYWQGLNEPNLSLFFMPQFDGNKAVSPTLYRTLINTIYAAVKAVNPSNLVIAAGLGPIAVAKYTIGPMRFTRELLCMRGHERFRPAPGNCHGGVHFDIFAIHPYTTGGPTHEGGPNDVQLGSLGRLQTLLGAADQAGRIKGQFKKTPLWITEFSWDSDPPDPGGLPMAIETRWAAEALHHAWSVGIATFFWFSLRDYPPEPGVSNAGTIESGLYFRGPTVEQDQPKDVFYAFRFPFVAYPREGGLRFWGRTPTSKPGKVSIQILKGSHWRRVFSTRADKAGIFRGVAPTHYGRGLRGSARAVYASGSSVPFSMKPIGDFPQPPFGRPVN
jgi:hypothetical protein